MHGSTLIHIFFSNTSRLRKHTYYFKYRGYAFKLVQSHQSPRADALLAVVADDVAMMGAYRAAAEFFSALAWSNGSRIAFQLSSAWSRPAPPSLVDAKPRLFIAPLLGAGSETRGHSISLIPSIQNEDQRMALATFREARAANNDYLKFSFYWQVLSISSKGGVVTANGIWDAQENDPHLQDLVEVLPRDGKSIGNYFEDECRHAIAHISRIPSETTIRFDDPADRLRIHLSVKAIEVFATYHIAHGLDLTQELCLYKAGPGAIPEYLPKGSVVMRQSGFA